MQGEATTRIVLARRYQVLGLLVAASALYWLAVVVWVTGASEDAIGHGTSEQVVALQAVTWSMDATFAWVAGAVAVHALLGAWTLWRRDREGGVGVALSGLFHLLFAVSWGVVQL